MAASDGRGFVASQDEMVGGTRKGKLLLTVGKPATAALIVPADGDHVAAIGENRKLLVFPLAQLPGMARGKGVRLQKYRDGGLSDAKVFYLDQGLTWKNSAGRSFNIAARICGTGSAIAPTPAAYRRADFRRIIASADRERR